MQGRRITAQGGGVQVIMYGMLTCVLTAASPRVAMALALHAIT